MTFNDRTPETHSSPYPVKVDDLPRTRIAPILVRILAAAFVVAALPYTINYVDPRGVIGDRSWGPMPWFTLLVLPSLAMIRVAAGRWSPDSARWALLASGLLAFILMGRTWLDPLTPAHLSARILIDVALATALLPPLLAWGLARAGRADAPRAPWVRRIRPKHAWIALAAMAVAGPALALATGAIPWNHVPEDLLAYGPVLAAWPFLVLGIPGSNQDTRRG